MKESRQNHINRHVRISKRSHITMNEMYTLNEVVAIIEADRKSRTTEEETNRILAELEAEEAAESFDYAGQRVCAIAVSDSRIVSIEDLLMQLALAQTVAISVAEYAEASDIDRDNMIPPSDWAVAGAHSAMEGVTHALKCLLYGHRNAYTH
jgi:hypothetical protein